MYEMPLDAMPLWGLELIALLMLLATIEIGYRIGRWRHLRKPDERDAPVGAMVGSTLGLLALVLGFTFNLSATRFESRRQAVLDEANAIGTTFLRSRLLPEPARTQTAKLLREYVDVRVSGVKERRIAELIERAEQLQELLWEQAIIAAEHDKNEILTGLFIQSLNEVIDLHASRVHVGIRSRVPIVLWAGLCGLTIVGMAAVGYQAGLSTTRRSPAMLGLVLAFTLVLAFIADLDRSQDGFLTVSQQALIDLQPMMHSPSP